MTSRSRQAAYSIKHSLCFNFLSSQILSNYIYNDIFTVPITLTENNMNTSNSYIIINVDFLGPDSSLIYNGYEQTLEVTMHGMIFNSAHMSGIQLSTKLNMIIEQHPLLNMEMIKEIRLFCCCSGFGGFFSVAQMIASYTGKQVRGYITKYSPPGSQNGYNNRPKVFYPKSKNLITKKIHTLLFYSSEYIFLPIRRRMR